MRVAIIGASAALALLVVTVPVVAQTFTQPLKPGETLDVTCPSVLSSQSGDNGMSAMLSCATYTPVPPTDTPTATATSTDTAVPTSTDTLVPTNTAVPTSTPVPSGDGATGDSMYMHQWSPTGAYAAPQPSGMPYCTAAEHDSFYVVGPDGLRYPTWHPPVMTRQDGSKCTFAHEHGDDPHTAAEWPQVQQRYAYRLPDGSLDMAYAGVPFGYMNQQMDNWEAATGTTGMAMRHEDHVGHKIAVTNNFTIGLDHGPGTSQFFYPGVTCNYLIEYHQGTHSKDAFENNLHGVLYNADCSDGHAVHVDLIGEFGKVGQFTRLCDGAGDRSTTITTGTDYASPGFPGTLTNGQRLIGDRSCVEQYFLVPSGSFSANPYEAWPVNLAIVQPNGNPVVDGLNLLFDVEDSVRYYWPGHASDGTTVDNLGHFQDLCTENLNGRTFRGGVCDQGTRSAAWNDPRAGFRDLNRGVYFKPGVTHNSDGSAVWYTDPFGGHAQTTPFPGSIKQGPISLDAMNYAQKAGGFETANVINAFHDDGQHTVHAPN